MKFLGSAQRVKYFIQSELFRGGREVNEMFQKPATVYLVYVVVLGVLALVLIPMFGDARSKGPDRAPVATVSIEKAVAAGGGIVTMREGPAGKESMVFVYPVKGGEVGVEQQTRLGRAYFVLREPWDGAKYKEFHVAYCGEGVLPNGQKYEVVWMWSGQEKR